MVKLFDINKYKAILNDAMAKGNLAETSARKYLDCIRVLNRHSKGKDPASIAKCIEEQAGTQVEAYTAAISFYENRVNGQHETIFYGKPKTELLRNFEPVHGKELDKKPDTYRQLLQKNAKYRVAFTLQMKSGLRVSEVAALTPRDIMIKDGHIKVYVRKGKGGKSRIVDVLPSRYLVRELPKVEKFPTIAQLKEDASKMHFGTHDMRRLNARERFWRYREEGMTKNEARREVARQLGHEKVETTNWYLGVEKDKTKNDFGY